MSDLFISIIIPTYNEQERIGKLLEHLKKCCAETPHEIIIADGGSKDRTVQIAEKSGAVVIHCLKKGRAAQMNKGAEHSNGTILYFLHADTLPPIDFVDHITKAFREGYRSGCFRLSFGDPHPILKFYSWFTRFPDDSFSVWRPELICRKKTLSTDWWI
jgi:glycosyltransferase involved in cell wall biosynthesis